MLEVGQRVPDFEGEASTGGTLTRAELRGEPFVLFFYPKSFTTGCTIETREFARMAPEIRELGAKVVAVSIDKLDTQCNFAKETGAEFPILADPDGKISKAFDVKRMLLPVAKRVTYVVDEEGTVEAVFAMELRFKEHVQEVLDHLKSRGE